jgi:plasmid rolling circle replication initiator protein Rep
MALALVWRGFHGICFIKENPVGLELLTRQNTTGSSMFLTDVPPSVEAEYPARPVESTGTSVDCLTDYSPKDRPWDVHKAQADRIAALYAQETQFRALGSRVHRCAGLLVFAWVPDMDTGELWFRLRGARFCRVRHCPICQWRRSMMWQARFYEALPSLQENYPRHRWLFLTLTVRNCPVTELRTTLGNMVESWKRLIKRPEFRPVVGFVRTTEITRSEDNSAHPHFHCLLMVKPSYFGVSYVSQARWVELWQDCARLDYAPVVDVRAVKGDLSKAVQETLKYAVKPSDMEGDSDWFMEMTRQVYKLRFVATGGVLKDVLKSESNITNEDLVMAEGDQTVVEECGSKFWFGWNRSVKRYRKIRDDS